MKKTSLVIATTLILFLVLITTPAQAIFRGFYGCNDRGHVNGMSDPTLQTIALQCQVEVGLVGYFYDTLSMLGIGEYPISLDSAANGICNRANPCLTEIQMLRPLTDPHWSKVSTTQYDRSTGESCVWDGAGAFSCTY